MNMHIKKKGLSPVIATIALVLLTITAMAIIASFIVPLVNKNLNEGTECFPYRDYFYFEEDNGYNCYNVTGGNVLYGVSVGAITTSKEKQEKVIGFTLVFSKQGTANAVKVINGTQTNSNRNGIRMLNKSLQKIEIPDAGEVRTYVYNSTENYTSIEIHTILNNERVCDSSDSIKVGGILCVGLPMEI